MSEVLKLLATFASYDKDADVREFKNYIRYFCKVQNPQHFEDTVALFDFDQEDFSDSIDAFDEKTKQEFICEIYRYQLFNFIPNSPRLKFRSDKLAKKIAKYMADLGIDSEVKENTIKLTPDNKYKIVGLANQAH